MNCLQILYAFFIQPIQLILEYIYAVAYNGTSNSWLSLLVLCVTVSILLIPIFRRSEEIQSDADKRDKKNSRLIGIVKQYPFLVVDIPIFIATYCFISSLTVINEVSFGPIADLGSVDGLLKMGAISICYQ